MPYLPTNFGLLDEADADYDHARVAVLPVPFERTVSYGHGTASGPAAIIRASQSMELYDEELGSEPHRLGIATLPPFVPEAHDMGEALAELEAEAKRHLAAGKFLLTLGGEHSLTIAPLRAAHELAAARGEEIGVVQFDAHADLRDEYEGTPHSHAAVMRRALELDVPILAIGLRAISTPEAELIAERELAVIWGWELADEVATAERFERLLDALPPTVYVTFDVDYFDPAVVPATGTPEPGGGHWWPTLGLLRTLVRAKRVVAMDVVELAPAGGPASDFVAARLAYKAIAYLAEAERGDGAPHARPPRDRSPA
jgi:agmatinase